MDRELVAAILWNTEQINHCHGLDARHLLLVQSVRELASAHNILDAQLDMAVSRLGGEVEGCPTNRINFLQRVDELVITEQEWLHESQ